MLIYCGMSLVNCDTKHNDLYRIVERRITGCEIIDYIPEKRGKISNGWFPLEYEYSTLFERSFPKIYNSLHEAKNAIKEDMKKKRKEEKRNIIYKGYEKIHEFSRENS